MNFLGDTRLVCLSFALHWLASSIYPVCGTPNLRSPQRYGPWGVNFTTFTDMLDHPNATTNFPLPGPNISASYPDAGPDESWVLSIAVADDIPASDSDVVFYTGTNASKFFTGSRIRLTAPPALALPPNSTTAGNISARADRNYTDWHICVQYWPFPSLSDAQNVTIPEQWRGDDGSCSTIATADCIRDWEAEVVKKYNPGAGTCSPVNVGDIASCSGVELLPRLGGVSTYFNSTDVGHWPGGQVDLIDYGGELHDRGNITAYNETGSLPWPVLVLWGSWAVKPNRVPGSLVQINTTAKLTCVRAMNATGGSIAPGWNSAAIGRCVAIETLWLPFALTFLAVWL